MNKLNIITFLISSIANLTCNALDTTRYYIYGPSFSLLAGGVGTSVYDDVTSRAVLTYKNACNENNSPDTCNNTPPNSSGTRDISHVALYGSGSFRPAVQLGYSVMLDRNLFSVMIRGGMTLQDFDTIYDVEPDGSYSPLSSSVTGLYQPLTLRLTRESHYYLDGFLKAGRDFFYRDLYTYIAGGVSYMDYSQSANNPYASNSDPTIYTADAIETDAVALYDLNGASKSRITYMLGMGIDFFVNVYYSVFLDLSFRMFSLNYKDSTLINFNITNNLPSGRCSNSDKPDQNCTGDIQYATTGTITYVLTTFTMGLTYYYHS